MRCIPTHKHIEIERKYLIRKPDDAYLRALEGCEWADIVQTYIYVGDMGNERVRKRGFGDRWTYTHTHKKRISDTRSIEQEREISLAEYEALIERADPALRVIHKRRYVLTRGGDRFEIDIYPFWQKQAVMEIELESEAHAFNIPPEISVIRELTGLREYGNAALTQRIPPED